MNQANPPSPSGYAELLSELKERIRTAQVRAGLAVNRELVLLYWRIGRDILVRQRAQGWGAGVVRRLADDLRLEFPGLKGLSRTNLMYMKKLAEEWPDEAIVQQLVGQIPWGHNVRLLDRVKDPDEREWYIRATIEHGWSRAILDYQIDSDLYLDLLFYHLRLRCYVVIELKTTDFRPEYTGKLNFYLSAVDDTLRHPDDQPSLGLIICRGRRGLVAEYALRDMGKPMGIAGHCLGRGLPEQFEGQLPSVEELEAELLSTLDHGVEEE